MTRNFNEDSLYRVFHENTKTTTIEGGEDARSSLDKPTITSFPGSDFISFGDQPSGDVLDIIQNRRSPFSFTGEPVSGEDLETLLTNGAGVTGKKLPQSIPRRAYPSAGARYPIETYVCLLSCSDVEHGLYHFNPMRNGLEQLQNGDFREDLSFVASDLIETASLVVFLTADFKRTTKKYGDFGYRLVMQESGHLMQNFCLLSEHLGLSCRPVSGFVEQEADQLLSRYGDETTIYAGIVGIPPSDIDD